MYVQIVVGCHFRGSFHHNLQNQSPLQMKVVRTFSLRFVSYILLLLLFVLLLLFFFFLSAQHERVRSRSQKLLDRIV
jgi:type II secretory pathway component PulF